MTLTREEILRRNPGPELDALVAKHVMGWTTGESWGGIYWVDLDKCNRYEKTVFKPSRYINIAWEVESIFDQDTPLREDYAIELHNVMGLMLHEPTTLNNIYQFAHATPEQRCKAALLAVLNL